MSHLKPVVRPPRNSPGLLLLCLLSLAMGLRAADWPQWRGPNRDGTTPDTDWPHEWPGGEPRVAWKTELGAGLSTVVVADGLAYGMGNRAGSNTVWCLDAATGAVRWRYDYAEPLMDWQFEGGPCSTPLVAGGRVYAAGRSGRVHCLDAATGRMAWEANLKALTGLKPGNWGLNGSPVLHDGRLVLNFGTAGMALNPADGSRIWLSGPADNAYTSPVTGRLGGRDVLFVAASELLAVVEPGDGRISWSEKFHVGFKAGDPVPVAGGVFFSSIESGGVFVAMPDSGEPKVAWASKRLGSVTGTPVPVGGHLYGVLGANDGKGALTCLETATGKVLWSKPGFGWGSLLAAGDRLVVLSEKGEASVVRASPRACEVLARFQVIGGKCWAAPTLADRRLFVRNARGNLVVLDLAPSRTTKSVGRAGSKA
jgi:outer membrane protein assembly factor BamB